MGEPTRAVRRDVLESEAVQIACAIEQSLSLSNQSRPRFMATAQRFFSFCRRGYRLGSLTDVTAEIAHAFVIAPLESGAPSVATMHVRRAVVRFVFRQARDMGLGVNDPCVDLRLPARSTLAARPLADDEIAVGRSFSLASVTDTRAPAAWALAEATARTAELPHIRAGDVDLMRSRVWLHGSARTIERWAPLTDWGATQLARRIAAVDDAELPLVYAGCGGQASGQASSCIAIKDTLTRSGFADEPDLRPVSVAAWAGRVLLDATGRIDAVARLLGVRSLDRAARIVAWNWTVRDNA